LQAFRFFDIRKRITSKHDASEIVPDTKLTILALQHDDPFAKIFLEVFSTDTHAKYIISVITLISAYVYYYTVSEYNVQRIFSSGIRE
jgi:hypothetical protein